MAHKDFSVSVTPNAVDVRLTPSAIRPHGKLVALLSSLGMIVLFNCFSLFMPGKHNRPSMWTDITTGSSAFPLSLLAVGNLFMSWVVFRGERGSSPSDETFHCDRNEIVISRTSWFDFQNCRWRTYAYPLSECSDIRFAKIFVAGRSAIDGIRFLAKGRRQWALPGLDAPEAKQILIGLKNLGADVPEDPYVENRIKQAAELSGGDTSWMDRSWMDDSKSPTDKS